jgi:hypothetical protein
MENWQLWPAADGEVTLREYAKTLVITSLGECEFGTDKHCINYLIFVISGAHVVGHCWALTNIA